MNAHEEAMVRILSVLLGLAICFLVVKYGVLSALRAHARERTLPPLQPVKLTRYKVTGKDRSTGLDTTGYYTAGDEADARSRASADGVIVGTVERA